MMKRILIITGIFSPDIGGPASYASMIGTFLANEGASVAILTYSPVYSFAPDRELSFKVFRVWNRIPWGVRHIIFFFRAWWLIRRADSILLLNATSAGYAGAVAARLARKPFLVRIAGDYAWEIAIQTGRTHLLINDFQRSAKHGKIHWLNRIQQWVCRRAKKIIVPSQYLANLVAGWGVPRDKILVIYNSVDIVPAEKGKEDARRQIGIAGNVILSIGRLVPWKGFRMLIKIMPQLFEINQFFRLVIVGDGPDRKLLEAMIRNLGLERKVFLIGAKPRSELPLYFAAADMFVLNTGYEGFSHQILEAMTCGIPVISTVVGGNTEIIRQGENGFLVKYNDEYNLVEAIKTIEQMDEIRDRFIEEGKKTVAQFSTENMFCHIRKFLMS